MTALRTTLIAPKRYEEATCHAGNASDSSCRRRGGHSDRPGQRRSAKRDVLPRHFWREIL